MGAELEERVVLDLKPVMKILLGLVLLGILYVARQLVFLLMLTLVFSAAIYPAVQWLARRGLPLRGAILVFYLAFFAVMGTVFYFAGDLMISQTRTFLECLPRYVISALNFLQDRVYLPGDTSLVMVFKDQLVRLYSRMFHFLVSAVNYALVLVSILVSVVVMLALTFYLLSDLPYFRDVVMGALPLRYRARVRKMLYEGAGQLGKYIRGMLTVMLTDGVLAWIGLSMIGVPYAFLLGVLTFFLNIIPLIGSTLAGVLVVVIALGHEPIQGLWALLLYLGIQALEVYVLSPNILGRSVQLHPVWVLISVLAGGNLFGFWGVLLAVPTAVILKILIHEFYIDRRVKNGTDAGAILA